MRWGELRRKAVRRRKGKRGSREKRGEGDEEENERGGKLKEEK
jgi:hypothetical protein